MLRLCLTGRLTYCCDWLTSTDPTRNNKKSCFKLGHGWTFEIIQIPSNLVCFSAEQRCDPATTVFQNDCKNMQQHVSLQQGGGAQERACWLTVSLSSQPSSSARVESRALWDAGGPLEVGVALGSTSNMCLFSQGSFLKFFFGCECLYPHYLEHFKDIWRASTHTSV